MSNSHVIAGVFRARLCGRGAWNPARLVIVAVRSAAPATVMVPAGACDRIVPGASTRRSSWWDSPSGLPGTIGSLPDSFCQVRLRAPGSTDSGYVSCNVLMHALPALVAFFATGWLGKLFDRSNPWLSWAYVRFVWGLDALLLAATPPLALLFPPALVVLPVAGRVLRGSVQGGWWILWWQIGVTHFAPPGGDTSRYMGIMVFLNGIIRFSASAAGMILAALAVSPQTLLVVDGIGVIFSGFYSLIQGGIERNRHQPETIGRVRTPIHRRTTGAKGVWWCPGAIGDGQAITGPYEGVSDPRRRDAAGGDKPE